MLPAWLELAGTIVRANQQPNGWPRPGAGASADENSAGAAAAISVEIASAKPIRVSLDVGHGADRLSLMTHGLRAVEPDKPALSDINFKAADKHGRATLQIRVPDSQPSGLYSGVVVERESGEVRGTLVVRLLD
jgi:hypothetical protein